jgi:DMSO reductase anchor subunit
VLGTNVIHLQRQAFAVSILSRLSVKKVIKCNIFFLIRGIHNRLYDGSQTPQRDLLTDIFILFIYLFIYFFFVLFCFSGQGFSV